MNIFYTLTSKWEYCFFKNDIFKRDLYDMKFKFILFNKYSEFNINYEHNIIVINSAIPLNFLENMIKKLKPFIIFHLGDELGKDIKYYNLYSKYSIKYLFHQYNFENIDYKINHLQIPLGYVSGFLLNNSLINRNQIKYNKKYDFSFIGQIKNDRKEMLNKFSNNFKNNFISIGRTNWSNLKKQNINPYELYNIYKNTLFVPIGRGNSSLDCFRIYETISAGAIPIICGSIEEINKTFKFNNIKPHLIISDTWDNAVLLCRELYYDKDRIYNIINFNYKWLQDQVINISKKVNECYKYL